MAPVALVVVLLSAANALAFRPGIAGSWQFWAFLAVPYVLAAGFGMYRMWEEGTLTERITPRWGDISIGVITVGALLVASWVARSAMAPAGTPQQAWLFRIYLQVGNTDALQKSSALTALLLGIPVLEELVWRGYVLGELERRVGNRRGWMLATLLYAVTLLPTAYTLRDPVAGLNPLLPVAALGAGMVWSFEASRLKRLAPVALSHMAFTYFSAVQFHWPGM